MYIISVYICKDKTVKDFVMAISVDHLWTMQTSHMDPLGHIPINYLEFLQVKDLSALI